METERILVDLDKICRACMTDEGEMTSVFNKTENEDISIVDMLESCSFLHIDPEDGLPPQICLVCYGLVYQAYNFKAQCQKSEEIMKSYLSDDSDGIKVVKIEEVLTSCDNDITNEIILKEDFTHFEEVTTVVECDKNDESSIDSVDFQVTLTFCCSDCNEIFRNSEEYETHNKECHNKKLLSCPRCARKFKYEEALNSHFITCTTVECHLCNKKFRAPGFLQNHMKKHDPLLVTKDKRFKCTECDKAYTSPANLTVHQYSHSGVKPYKCEYCGRGFTKLMSLNSHVALHTGKKTHLCSECGRGFTSSAILNQHKKIHSGHKPYTCTVCSKSFTASGDLKIHMRSHTGEKPYLCTTCGKAFSRVTHLNTHIRIHTGERPYICQDCGRRFTQAGDLRSHRRTHTGERPYVCSVCNKSFIQSSALSAHMATHSGVKNHICNVCNRAFSQASSLARHLKCHE